MFAMIIAIFNSNFFVGLVTFAASTAAFAIYFLTKRDKKREAANIILLEIQSAERKLGQIKASLAETPPTLPAGLRLLQTESWNKHRFLFIRDFDRDEWDTLTDFYNKCQLIDETLDYNEKAFWNDVEQIRANKQRILADYAKEHAEKISASARVDELYKENFLQAAKRFDELYMSRQGHFAYTPDKTIIDARLYIGDLNLHLSQTAIGTKLKALAKVEV